MLLQEAEEDLRLIVTQGRVEVVRHLLLAGGCKNLEEGIGQKALQKALALASAQGVEAPKTNCFC